MTFRLLLFAAWIATGLSLYAAPKKLDYLTVGSMTYSNVTVLGVNASDIYFTSDHGIRNVKLRLLTPDMQKAFDYDPVAAAQAEEQQAEDEKRYHDNLAAQIAAEYNAARTAKDAAAQAMYAEAGLADPATADSPLGKTAPPLDMDTWVGTRQNLDRRLAIIFLWSPKSPSCKKWIPELNDLFKTLSDRIIIVGVTVLSQADVMQADPKPLFPCAIDSDAKFTMAANVTTFPCVMLLDPNHVIRYEGHPAALTAEILENILKQAGSGQPASDQTTEQSSAQPASTDQPQSN